MCPVVDVVVVVVAVVLATHPIPSLFPATLNILALALPLLLLSFVGPFIC